MSAGFRPDLHRLHEGNHQAGAVGSAEQRPHGHKDLRQGEEAHAGTVLPGPPRDIHPVLRRRRSQCAVEIV